MSPYSSVVYPRIWQNQPALGGGWLLTLSQRIVWMTPWMTRCICRGVLFWSFVAAKEPSLIA